MNNQHRRAQSEIGQREKANLAAVETQFADQIREAQRQSDERRAEAERPRQRQKDLEASIVQEQERYAEKVRELERRRFEVEQQREQRNSNKGSMISILGVLAGLGTMAAGVITLHPPLAAMGAGMAGSAAGSR